MALYKLEDAFTADSIETTGDHRVVTRVGKKFRDLGEGDHVITFDADDGLDDVVFDGGNSILDSTVDGVSFISPRWKYVWGIAFPKDSELITDLSEYSLKENDSAVIWYEDADGGLARSDYAYSNVVESKVVAFNVSSVSNDTGFLTLNSDTAISHDPYRRSFVLGGPDVRVRKAYLVHKPEAIRDVEPLMN